MLSQDRITENKNVWSESISLGGHDQFGDVFATIDNNWRGVLLTGRQLDCAGWMPDSWLHHREQNVMLLLLAMKHQQKTRKKTLWPCWLLLKSAASMSFVKSSEQSSKRTLENTRTSWLVTMQAFQAFYIVLYLLKHWSLECPTKKKYNEIHLSTPVIHWTTFKRLLVDTRNQSSLSRLENFGQDAAFPSDCRQNAAGLSSSVMNFSEWELKCAILGLKSCHVLLKDA